MPSSSSHFNGDLDEESANPEVDSDIPEAKADTVDLSTFPSKRSTVKSRKSDATSSMTAKYTPLEKQVVEIKEKNPDVLLFVECGYKYRFFGEDAEVKNSLLAVSRDKANLCRKTSKSPLW